MDKMSIYILIGIIAFCIISFMVYFLIRYKKRRKYIDFNISTKIKTSNILSRFAILNFCKVINDYSFNNKGNSYHFDHILIGRFGILVINSKVIRGEIYGDLSDKNWINYKGDDKIQVSNYVNELDESITALRDNFSKDKVYKIKITKLIVFLDKKLEIFLKSDLPYIKLAKLSGFLNNPDFCDKGNFDVTILKEHLMNYKN